MNRKLLCVDVPVRNRDRAIAFYSALLGLDLAHDCTSQSLRFEERPDDGVLIHLNIDSLDDALEVVWSQGGRVLEPERVADGARCALVLDTEGNRVELYAA